MQSMRTVLIVSPYFPPSTVAGVHRARHLAKHLPSAGWHPIVVAVDEAFHEERLDPGLAALVPNTVEVAKVTALSARLARPLGIGDLSIRGYSKIRGKVIELVESRSVDCILITGAPYYPMLLAPLLKRVSGTPVVLDFQDPWVSTWGASQSAFSKFGMADRLARVLEPRVLAAAAYITSVSDNQNAEMADRHPWLDAGRMAALPIGFDADDFAALGAATGSGVQRHLAPGGVNLSFVGTLMPRSAPTVNVMLRAFARCREEHPREMKCVRLNFVGTSNLAVGSPQPRVRPMAAELGIEEAVYECPERVPYLEALGVLARSDGILLVGSDEPHYTASKIYPGLMSGRPWCSLYHASSSSHAILSAAGGGLAHAFADAGELADLEAKLAASLLRIVIEPETLGTCAREAYAMYEASAIARRFADIFEIAIGRAR